MSAYHVGQDHINALLSYAKQMGISFFPGSEYSWQKLGQILSTENDLSVNYRYSEDNHTPYEWVEDLYFCAHHTPIDVLKMLSCYEYQSCEHPTWNSSSAKEMVDNLRDDVICKLPGYEVAVRDYKKPVIALKVNSFTDEVL